MRLIPKGVHYKSLGFWLCEGCEKEVLGSWPSGWVGCGTSRLLVRERGFGRIMAMWCPDCDGGPAYRHGGVPTTEELIDIRHMLRKM